MLRWVILCFLFSLSLPVFAGTGIDNKVAQVSELEAILRELKTYYGMIPHKKEFYETSYKSLYPEFKKYIETATTLEEAFGFAPKKERKVLPPDEFRQLMIGLGARFRDGHLTILRQTDDSFTLGIHTAAVNGELVIVGFNKDIYVPATNPPLQVNDFVLAVDGVQVQNLAKEFMLYTVGATYATRFDDALESILNVNARNYRPKKEAHPVTVKFGRRLEDGTLQEFEGRFRWINVKTVDAHRKYTSALIPHRYKSEEEQGHYIFGDQSTYSSFFLEGLSQASKLSETQSGYIPSGGITDLTVLVNYETSEAADAELENSLNSYFALKSKKAAKKVFLKASLQDLPSGEAVDRYYAYTVQYEGTRIGVLRIPDFLPDTEEFANELAWLKRLFTKFKHQTDVLIVDLLSNSGGLTLATAPIARFFAHDKPLKSPMMNFKLNENVLRLKESFAQSFRRITKKANSSDEEDIGDDLAGDSYRVNFGHLFLTNQLVKDLKEKYAIGEEWSGSVSTLGTSIPFLENDFGQIVGIPESYDKPVLVLVDSKTASAAEIFASVLQSNNRAYVFGVPTAGLGAPSYRETTMPGSELEVQCTMGYLYRPDYLPIENLGVIPDLRRPLTYEDIRDSFNAYTHDVLAAAVEIAKKKPLQKIQARLEASNQVPKSKNKLNRVVEKTLLEVWTTPQDSIQKTIKTYEKAIKKINEIKTLPEFDERKVNWQCLIFPIPTVLLEKDIMLAPLRKKTEVLNRLDELLGLSLNKLSKEEKRLILVVRDLLELLGPIETNGCRAHLYLRERTSPEPKFGY